MLKPVLLPLFLLLFADMRGDVQAIFKETPHDKQVMMFSATLAKDIRAVCKKFMNKVREPWKGGMRSTAGQQQPPQAAVASTTISSTTSPSTASMHVCLQQQHQQPPFTPQLPQHVSFAARCRSTGDAWVLVQPVGALFFRPCWAAQALVQSAAAGAG